MPLQQQEPFLYRQKLTNRNGMVSKDQPIFISLPKMSNLESQKSKLCFKDYENGCQIIKQLPLLIFKSQYKHSNKNKCQLRYNSELNVLERQKQENRFFKNYIRRSFQRRINQKQVQNQKILKIYPKDKYFLLTTFKSIKLIGLSLQKFKPKILLQKNRYQVIKEMNLVTKKQIKILVCSAFRKKKHTHLYSRENKSNFQRKSEVIYQRQIEKLFGIDITHKIANNLISVHRK